MKKRCPSCEVTVSTLPLPRRKVRCPGCGKRLVADNRALEFAAILIAAMLAWALPAERMAWWVLAVSYLAIGVFVGWIGLLLTPLKVDSSEDDRSGRAPYR